MVIPKNNVSEASSLVAVPAVRPVPEAKRFKPAPKAQPAPEIAEAPFSAKGATPVTSVVQAQIVKVKEGIVHIVGKVGSWLLFIEVEVGVFCNPVKVWVIEVSTATRAAFEARFGPALNTLKEKSDALVSLVKGKAHTLVEPIYVKVIDGVLRIRGSVGGAMFNVVANISETWTSCKTSAFDFYAATLQSAERRLQPIAARAVQAWSSAKEKMLDTFDPYFAQLTNGVLYVRAAVGGSLVHLKVKVGEVTSRIHAAALQAHSNLSALFISYTGPAVAKVVAMHEAINTWAINALEPFLSKAHDGIVHARVRIAGVTGAIKLKSLEAYKKVAMVPMAFYVTVKDGFIHVRRSTGNTICSLKLCASEYLNYMRRVAAKVQRSVGDYTSAAKVQFSIVQEKTKTKLESVSANMCRVAGDPNVKVTAASAVGGAAVLGASGGACGVLAGGAFGAALGVPAAFLTFGLSIPVGAAIGSGAGFCAGSVAGGAVGLISGGVAGRKIHDNKASISEGFAGTVAKVSGYKDLAVEKAGTCKSLVAERTSASAALVRARLVSGTGGTA